MDRLKKLLEYHDEDPDDSFIRFALATEYLKLGQEEKARNSFEELVSHDPDYVGTYFHLGKLYERLDQNERAIQVFKNGITVAGAQSDMHSRAELQSALLEAEGMGYE
ncbi:MAG: tetratricopeptide repeat protein [Bacteroidetes bacterium]|nr:MAG: tetratricopeptide repeat protein [Bacteroidota bacterium]